MSNTLAYLLEKKENKPILPFLLAPLHFLHWLFAKNNATYPQINETQNTNPFRITGNLNSKFDVLLDSGINTKDNEPKEIKIIDNIKNIIIFFTKSPLVCECI